MQVSAAAAAPVATAATATAASIVFQSKSESPHSNSSTSSSTSSSMIPAPTPTQLPTSTSTHQPTISNESNSNNFDSSVQGDSLKKGTSTNSSSSTGPTDTVDATSDAGAAVDPTSTNSDATLTMSTNTPNPIMQQHSLPDAASNTNTDGAHAPIIAQQIDAASPLKHSPNGQTLSHRDDTGPIAPDLNFHPTPMQSNATEDNKSHPVGSVPPRSPTETSDTQLSTPPTNHDQSSPPRTPQGASQANVTNEPLQPQLPPPPTPPAGSNKAVRARSASQMLDVHHGHDQSRPAKRIALPKPSISTQDSIRTESASPNPSSKPSISSAESQQNPAQGKTSTTVVAQSLPVEAPRIALRSGQPVKKPPTLTTPIASVATANPSNAIVTSMPAKPPTMAGRLVFRSAPAATTGGTKTLITESNQKERKQPPKKARSKPKSVRWKKDSELVHVVSIDNRMDLIRSWDPDSEITLPFTSMTLANLRAAIASEDNALKNPPNTPMHDAFAPGNHNTSNDMDDARRKLEQLRLEQKRKLDAMQPNTDWPNRQYQVILPAECKIEENVEVFTVCQSLDNLNEKDNQRFPIVPRSPPQSTIEHSNSYVDVPWYDPSAARKEEQTEVVPNSSVTQHHDELQNQNRYVHPNGAQTQSHNQFRSQPYDANNAAGPQHQYQQQYRQQHYPARDDHINGAPQYQPAPTPTSFTPPRYHHGHHANPHAPQQPTPISNIPHGDLQRLIASLQEQGMHPPPGTPGFYDGPPPCAPPGAPPVPPPGVPQGAPHAVSHGMPPGAPPPPPPYFMPAPPPPPPHMVHMIPPPPQRFNPNPGQAAGNNRQNISHVRRNKKKCKYFGTKNGCRDGDSCTFSHEI